MPSSVAAAARGRRAVVAPIFVIIVAAALLALAGGAAPARGAVRYGGDDGNGGNDGSDGASPANADRDADQPGADGGDAGSPGQTAEHSRLAGEDGGAGGAAGDAETPHPPAVAAGEGAGAVSPPPAPPAQPYETVVKAPSISALAARADRTAASSVVRPDDSPRAFDDVGTLLLEVPGVHVTRRGGLGAPTMLSLRGSNPDQVRVYVDGVPLNEALGDGVDLSKLPLGDVESVEVYRGSSPIAFGQSALGGVVAINTRTPGDTRATARLGGGSFRTLFGDATASGRAGETRLYAGAHLLSARNDYPAASPAAPGVYAPGQRENAGLLQVDGAIRAARSLPGRRELQAAVLTLMRDQGVPSPVILRSTVARSTAMRLLAYVRYASRDDLGAGGKLEAALYARLTRQRFSDPYGEVSGAPVATRDSIGGVGATLTPEKALGGWGRLGGVLEGRLERFMPTNDRDRRRAAGYPADRALMTAGAELTAHVAPLDLYVVPSARLELSREVRTGRSPDELDAQLPPGPPTSRALPVARLGLRRPFGAGVELLTNVGRYARIPSFFELYGYDRGVLGNPELRPERGVNADVGLVLRRVREDLSLLAAATAFGSRVDDLVVWESTAYYTRAENAARARILGAECELRLRTPRLGIVAQATLTDARDDGTVPSRRGSQLAYHPRYRGYARIERHHPLAGGRLVASVYADADVMAGNPIATSKYGSPRSRLLVGAGAALEQRRTGLRLAAHGANLGDARVEDFPLWPQPGRTVFVSLSWSGFLPNKE